jgi:hypothetical protein
LSVLKSLLRRRWLLGVVVAALALDGCGGGGSVSLARLAANQDAYIGKQVRTDGTVEAQANMNRSRYYVLTDQAQNLLVLVPARLARRYVGKRVSVAGRFGFNVHVGRLIRIARIMATG